MVLDKSDLQTTFGYHCSCCGASVLSGVSLFALSGDLVKLKCTCGGSEANVRRSGGGVSIEVPCLLCRGSHKYPLSASLFAKRPRDKTAEKEALRMACPFTGAGTLFLGEREAVAAAMEEDNETLKALLAEAGITPEELLQAEPAIEDDEAQFGGFREIARFMLAELDEEGKIRCDCQDDGEIPLYDFEMLPGRARIFCECCRREALVPMRNTADAEAFLKIDSLKLE